jgi:hypothetical protein
MLAVCQQLRLLFYYGFGCLSSSLSSRISPWSILFYEQSGLQRQRVGKAPAKESGSIIVKGGGIVHKMPHKTVPQNFTMTEYDSPKNSKKDTPG